MTGSDVTLAQVRIARPTRDISALLRFYRDALGLEVVTTFTGHEGYDGVVLALPGRDVHLEFTYHEAEQSTQAPSRDDLLVLYLPDLETVLRLCERLESHGFPQTGSQNPFWARRGSTFEDPEGWRIVLVASSGMRPSHAKDDQSTPSGGPRAGP